MFLSRVLLWNVSIIKDTAPAPKEDLPIDLAEALRQLVTVKFMSILIPHYKNTCATHQPCITLL